MNKLADKIIISSDENRKYLDFWPHVAYAYRTIFPGVKVELALVTDRPPHDPLLVELEKHGTVWSIPTVEGYPMVSQAKMARYLIAATQGIQVCYIDDLDQIPIDRDWHLRKVRDRPEGAMLLVGREVYANAYPEQVPASMMTAEGHVFAKLFGIADMGKTIYGKQGLTDWFNYLYGMRTSDEDHTNIKLNTFSDEALIVKLRAANLVPERHVERGYVVGGDTIDRGYWPFDIHRLQTGGYLAAHTARPYREYRVGNDAIIRYICDRYKGGALPEPLA